MCGCRIRSVQSEDRAGFHFGCFVISSLLYRSRESRLSVSDLPPFVWQSSSGVQRLSSLGFETSHAMSGVKRVQMPLVCHGHTRPIVELEYTCELVAARILHA